jgi:hypothetical protein
MPGPTSSSRRLVALLVCTDGLSHDSTVAISRFLPSCSVAC